MPRKLNTKSFIAKAREVHGDKYDYSKVEYVNNSTKVTIICPEHGPFEQTPNKHLIGQGCPECGSKKSTIESFVAKAREVHGDKYDYSKVEYVNNYTKVTIVCPEHGPFEQTPNNHLSGHGCDKCGGSQKLTIEYFIAKAREVHGDKYDYSKVDYKDSKTKVTIVCPEHGPFEQTPNKHLIGQGCPECGGSQKSTIESFVAKAREVHGDKYDYSKVEYVNNDTKVTIICPEHGPFEQIPKNHLKGHGCNKCWHEDIGNSKRMSRDEFITRSKEIHGDKYDYSKVDYKDSKTKVTIVCPEHGPFEQTPIKHLSGQGCPECRQSKLEMNISQYLKNKEIKYIEQKTWDWLVYKGKMRCDIYLPDFNIVIECQGRQHFEPVEYFGGEDSYCETTNRDILKKQILKEHGVKVLYYTNVLLETYPYNVYTDLDTLYRTIVNEKSIIQNRV